jgi:hypothetical protein
MYFHVEAGRSSKVTDLFETNSRCSKVQGLMADIGAAKGQEEPRSDGAQTNLFSLKVGWRWPMAKV